MTKKRIALAIVAVLILAAMVFGIISWRNVVNHRIWCDGAGMVACEMGK